MASVGEVTVKVVPDFSYFIERCGEFVEDWLLFICAGVEVPSRHECPEFEGDEAGWARWWRRHDAIVTFGTQDFYRYPTTGLVEKI